MNRKSIILYTVVAVVMSALSCQTEKLEPKTTLDTHLTASMEQMLCKTDNWRGEWMLNKIMNDGNFGWYAPHHRQQQGTWRRFFATRWRHVKMMRFDFWEMLWVEIKYWKRFFELIPARIRFRTLSLKSIPDLNG